MPCSPNGSNWPNPPDSGFPVLAGKMCLNAVGAWACPALAVALRFVGAWACPALAVALRFVRVWACPAQNRTLLIMYALVDTRAGQAHAPTEFLTVICGVCARCARTDRR